MTHVHGRISRSSFACEGHGILKRHQYGLQKYARNSDNSNLWSNFNKNFADSHEAVIQTDIFSGLSYNSLISVRKVE